MRKMIWEEQDEKDKITKGKQTYRMNKKAEKLGNHPPSAMVECWTVDDESGVQFPDQTKFFWQLSFDEDFTS